MTVAVIAAGILTLKERSFGHPYTEALVLATLFGFGLRSGWQPISRYEADIAFSAKGLLEGAVAMLGAPNRTDTDRLIGRWLRWLVHFYPTISGARTARFCHRPGRVRKADAAGLRTGQR
ncbi:hypothetical protein ABEV34_18140 [Methylorubrum rhodesianum]|uniref:hypothetical protein n=1 Tax=Methylorubrum rhodesianum TaxID=29427 RepID=UPI0016120898|nr:hypothetical protein [Methylorubrum rhodesianum]MBB5760544.1 hypothetical protein [Methylorubrum rhodesianum]